MSFGFTVVGDREQVTAQLKAVDSDESLKSGLASLLTEFIGLSELHGYTTEGTGWRQVYVIEASGHSGPGSALSLNVSIKCPYIPVATDAADPEPVAADAAPDADED